MWAVLVLAVQVVLPWAISKIGPRLGWSDGTPAIWNLAGFLGVAIGLGLYIWCLTVHFLDYPSSVRVGFAPPNLVVAGPYRLSRNPMYLSALVAWFGWTIFYGSPAVLIAFAILWTVFALRVIPMEERQLQDLFGEDYIEYMHLVRRWFGRF